MGGRGGAGGAQVRRGKVGVLKSELKRESNISNLEETMLFIVSIIE